MVEVFKEAPEGPATHALVIGIEARLERKDAIPFSARASADLVASWLRTSYHNPSVPLATLELVASTPKWPRPSGDSEPVGQFRGAMDAWRERLSGNSQNIGLLYVVASAIGEDGLLMEMGETATDESGFLDIEKAWQAMADCPARQLFFIDSCPARRFPGDTKGMTPPLTMTASPAVRYRFQSRTPTGNAKVKPGSPTCLSRALVEVLNSGPFPFGAVELTRRLPPRFRALMSEAGLGEHGVLHVIGKGDFLLHEQRTATTPTPPPPPPPPSPTKPAKTLSKPGAKKVKPAAPAAAAGGIGEAERLASLTKRQRQCLGLAESGLTSPEIAERLGIDHRSVERHISAAKRRLGPHSSFTAEALLAGTGIELESEAADAGETEEAPKTRFVDDDPEVDRDDLGRGPLAVVLARRLHRIWCRSNGVAVPGDETSDSNVAERAGFVLHLDAPWGGGKTTFANFLARVLNPFPAGAARPARFLLEAINVPAERIGEPQPLGTIFIDDPPAQGQEDAAAAFGPDGRRPWIIVPFNAWRAEHCAPPWWVFYQAIRKGCLQAILAEGTAAAEPGATRAAERPSLTGRFRIRAEFLWREFWWRLRNPKVVTRLATFAITAVVLLILWRTGIIFRGEGGGPELNAGNAVGFLLVAIGGISGLWGVGALLTESMAPGLDDAAERRSLGSNDPLERFRRHFARTIAASKRPVMVIIDDLDRCRPDFVVDLVRGIQTLLRSPRIVFVILGDRAWIERAFEAHHEAMKMINVGPEQSFGARFVQKAIQMSFILPEIPDDKQCVYVRRVLIGDQAAAAGEAAPTAPAEISQNVRDKYREAAASAKSPEALQKAEKKLQDDTARQLMEACAPADRTTPGTEPAGGETQAPAAAPAAPVLTEEDAKAQAAKILDKERALLAAVDDRIGRDLLHRFEPLAPFFPANPRQIKRIANAIGMYVCASYMHFGWKPQEERIFELAIWITIMTEWPETWRALAWWPELADHLAGETPAGESGEAGTATPQATLEREAARIRSEPMLSALITGKAAGRDGKIPPRPRLRTDSVRYFVELTPLYSGNARPAAEEAKSAPA